MKRAYLLNGTVEQVLLPTDLIFKVDVDTATYLLELLVNDYCYVILGGTEVIKVFSVQGDTLVVQRGLEGTQRLRAAVGTKLTYKITATEVLDATEFVGYTLNLSGLLALDSNGAISYGPYTLLALGGVVADKAENGYVLRDIVDNVGCCNGVEIPPEIPPLLQPYRVIDTNELRITDDGSYREYL